MSDVKLRLPVKKQSIDRTWNEAMLSGTLCHHEFKGTTRTVDSMDDQFEVKTNVKMIGGKERALRTQQFSKNGEVLQDNCNLTEEQRREFEDQWAANKDESVPDEGEADATPRAGAIQSQTPSESPATTSDAQSQSDSQSEIDSSALSPSDEASDIEAASESQISSDASEDQQQAAPKVPSGNFVTSQKKEDVEAQDAPKAPSGQKEDVEAQDAPKAPSGQKEEVQGEKASVPQPDYQSLQEKDLTPSTIEFLKSCSPKSSGMKKQDSASVKKGAMSKGSGLKKQDGASAEEAARMMGSGIKKQDAASTEKHSECPTPRLSHVQNSKAAIGQVSGKCESKGGAKPTTLFTLGNDSAEEKPEAEYIICVSQKRQGSIQAAHLCFAEANSKLGHHHNIDIMESYMDRVLSDSKKNEKLKENHEIEEDRPNTFYQAATSESDMSVTLEDQPTAESESAEISQSSSSSETSDDSVTSESQSIVESGSAEMNQSLSSPGVPFTICMKKSSKGEFKASHICFANAGSKLGHQHSLEAMEKPLDEARGKQQKAMSGFSPRQNISMEDFFSGAMGEILAADRVPSQS